MVRLHPPLAGVIVMSNHSAPYVYTYDGPANLIGDEFGLHGPINMYAKSDVREWFLAYMGVE